MNLYLNTSRGYFCLSELKKVKSRNRVTYMPVCLFVRLFDFASSVLRRGCEHGPGERLRWVRTRSCPVARVAGTGQRRAASSPRDGQRQSATLTPSVVSARGGVRLRRRALYPVDTRYFLNVLFISTKLQPLSLGKATRADLLLII